MHIKTVLKFPVLKLTTKIEFKNSTKILEYNIKLSITIFGIIFKFNIFNMNLLVYKNLT